MKSQQMCDTGAGSYPFRRACVTAVSVASVLLALMPAGNADALTEPPMSSEPVLITVTDLDLGAEAFDRLVEFGNGGHTQLGAIVAEAHGYFGGNETVGVGLGIGSGGLGYRPNVTIALWRTDIDPAAALAAIKTAVGVPANPTTNKGDCASACDGSGLSPVIPSNQPVAQPETGLSSGIGTEPPSTTNAPPVQQEPQAPTGAQEQPVSGAGNRVATMLDKGGRRALPLLVPRAKGKKMEMTEAQRNLLRRLVRMKDTTKVSFSFVLTVEATVDGNRSATKAMASTMIATLIALPDRAR